MHHIHFWIISILILAQGFSNGENFVRETVAERTTKHLNGVTPSIQHEIYESILTGHDVKAELLELDDLDDDPQWIEGMPLNKFTGIER